MKKQGSVGKIIVCLAMVFIVCLALTACELAEPVDAGKYYINDNAANELNKDNTTKDEAIDQVTGGIENLRKYLDSTDVSTTGYYMGMEFNVDAVDPATLDGGNFRLKIQAHLYTYPYLDDDGNLIYKYKNPKDGKYYDEPDAEGTYIKTSAQDIHNDRIRYSDILIEWYNGATNQMLIGMYFDGINSDRDDPGNVLYLNIQDYKRSFDKFGDTVLYQQLIRLLMSLSVEKLLIAGNVQGDAGVSSIRSLFSIAVNENYKLVLNDPVTSVLFYGITADAVAGTLTEFIQGIFKPFEDKVDPLVKKYLGFKFSVIGAAVINSVASDMQFFTEPDPSGTQEIMTGAYLSFSGAALSGKNNTVYNYVSDVTFEYGSYPPADMELDRDFYTPYEYGQYEFTGNLYIPLLNANYDALIRTDMQQYDNSTNNVFMEYRDIANGELMIGAYYRYEKTFIDISGMEYLYGWIDLNQLGFPKVYDESLNLAELLGQFFDAVNNGIVSIVDGILSPDKNDKENHLLEEIMKKTSMTEKDPNDIFSKNTETLTVDIDLIKAFLYETGKGTYTTRDIINVLDSMLPYTMDQIAIMLGVANAEIMLENTYFELTLNVDTNEITIKMLTNVGRDIDEGSLMIFQLDIVPVVVGQKVNIADVDFTGFKPLEQIYTYSATMNGNFIFSTAETVDMSKLLSATIGENSGLNTPYKLPTNAGVTFRLVYDQFVTDHEETDSQGKIIYDENGDPVVHKAGRSAFQLQMYLTGGSEETDVILRLASDDVAFNSDVYSQQPERAGELGYVWVSIECVKDNNTQRIPKVKIREDVFMNSMQAYLDGTSISDDAAELGKSEVNLSITSILFALIEDSYVVMEPEQLEITSSNETLQNIFRVKGLIGNIRVDAGFRQRVTGLQSIKKDYGNYQVGQFENITGRSPYDTELHDTVPVYFYDDYLTKYPEYVERYIKASEATAAELESYGANIYYKKKSNGSYVLKSEAGDDLTVYENYRNTATGEYIPYEYINTGWTSPYDLRIDKKKGFIQVYSHGGKVTVTREEIEVSSSSFFASEDAENQDISKVRFRLGSLKFVFKNERDGKYHYVNYSGEDVTIADEYVKIESGQAYIYYLGIIEMMYYAGDTRYYYFDGEYALTDDAGENVYIYAKEAKDFLFEYDADSIEITEAAKSQYAPRINGSFMGTIRRYTVVFTAVIRTELGKLIELNSKEFYSDEDAENKIPVYDEKGVLIEEKSAPIVLFVMEPCEPLAEEVAVNIQVNTLTEIFTLPATFEIDWDSVTLKGEMVVTNVVIAKGMMGEKTFPVRIIVTNREITPAVSGGGVTVYTEETSVATSNVPVVDVIEIDPYDYIIAKNDYFMDISNYNPDQYGADGDDPEYLRVYREKERDFVNKYFENYEFSINFNATTSNLYRDGVKEEYIATEYSNKNGDKFAWSFDRYDNGAYTEDKIAVTATEGSTYTALYLHAYFKGQLIALQVNVGQRILSHIKFGEDDTFDPAKVNGDKEPGDTGYVYGHYVANYFDESSYVLPVNPIFVFTDGANHYYEKVFDMSYIQGLSANGSYVIDNAYGLTWGNPEITNIGTKGSYYYEGEGENRVLVNRPFYISNVVRDENGTVTEEKDPTPTSNSSDKTSTSINWDSIFGVYKPHRYLGTYTNKYTKISILSSLQFPTTVISVTVECPQLDIAKATTTTGTVISEADDFDRENNGNKKVFTPSAVEMGSSTGYYIIDPLDKDTLVIPSTAVIGFTNEDGTKVAKHRFTNIEWCASFDAAGNPSFTNESGYCVLRKDGDDYVFNLSTEEAATTKIMAKIGSKVSGYQYVTVCVRVLSKDPQDVDFFTGAFTEGTRITGIERTDINYSTTSVGSKDITVYNYYVNTFADFEMPSYIRAYFGVNNERSEYYKVTWTLMNGKTNVAFNPNSVCNMMAKIGTGDVTIEIYLSVIVANHSIDKIELAESIGGYYVKAGDVDNYVLVGDMLKTDFDNKTIGLSRSADGAEQYVLVSMGQEGYENVPAGMIGLYGRLGDAYVLRETIYPYEFTERVYSAFNIYFQKGDVVTVADMTKLYIEVVVDELNTKKVKVSDAAEISYRYDSASSNHDKTQIAFRYYDNISRRYYYPAATADGKIVVYDENGEVYGTFTSQELSILVTTWNASKDDIKNKELSEIITGSNSEDFGGYVLNDIYVYGGGKVTFRRPSDNTTFTFSKAVFADGTTMTYEELVYRLSYLNAHRTKGYQVASVFDKSVYIRNLKGLFSVNDVVRPGNGNAFTESNDYYIGLGSGVGAYDMRVRLIFDGGYRLTVDSAATSEIKIQPYSENGYAQYGEKGFVLADETEISVNAVKSNGAGVEETFVYGGVGNKTLTDWYVEESSFRSIKKGTFIKSIEQSVVYSQKEYGTIVVSALTEEGFRITRTLVLPGSPEELENFNSVNVPGLLTVTEGKIIISDIYEYLPMTDYFAGTNYLPKSINVELNGNMVGINNINWKIDEDWYGKTEKINGEVRGVGALDIMTYQGTYNKSTQSDDKRLMATAEILGWESVENGKTVKHDSVVIKLYISIRSAEVVELPLNTGKLKLDTTAIEVSGNRTYYIEADAYNDADSSAMADGYFTLPSNLFVKYRSGISHTFSAVTYKYRNYEISRIPYNNYGVDAEKFVQMFAEKGIQIPQSSVDKSYVDLTVNVGLSQTLNLRVRFYDKTAENATMVIDTDDAVIRSAILSSLSSTSDKKTEEIFNAINQTRIRVNVENLYEQIEKVKEHVALPSADAIKSDMSEATIKQLLLDGWNNLSKVSAPNNVEKDALKNKYDNDSLYNYALSKLKEYVENNTDATVTAIYNAVHGNASAQSKKDNVTRLISNYSTSVFSAGYDYVIGEYIKLELKRVFVSDAEELTAGELGYAIYYKNKLEASFDYDYVIREIYRIREYVAAGMYDTDAAKTAYRAILEGAIETAIADTDAEFTDKDNTVSGKSIASESVRKIVVSIFKCRLGADKEEVEGFSKISKDIDTFIDSSASISAVTKRQLRKELRSMISEAMDFSSAKSGIVPEYLKDIIPALIEDNVASVQNFGITVTAIRRNLEAGVDVSSQIDTVITRGVNNYVKGIYIESLIAREIKKIQAINVEEGYYYIDPYYGYIAVPTKVIIDFDENSGGFSYTTTVSWTNDTVTGNVTYAGNARNDVYGYVSMWTELWDATDSAGSYLYRNKDVMKEISAAADEETNDKTWSRIKAENVAISNILLILESDAMINTYFTNTEIAELGKENCIIDLYGRYAKGKALLAKDPSAVTESGVRYDEAKNLFDRAKYTELNAVVNNSDTKQTQEISIVTVVRDRTLPSSQLRVLDDKGSQQTKVEVENPFEYSAKDLPNRIKVGDEYFEIVWSDVSINPLGNLSASTHTVYGNIKNSSGQRVSIELYVCRWEYAGVVNKSGGSIMNPLNFYFSESLKYSAEDSYDVRFNVYELVNGVETIKEYRTVTFYPEDSALLVNTTDDDGMKEVLARKNYVMYWDEMAVNNVINNHAANVEGDLALGNERVGSHNLTSLSLNSGNTKLPKKAKYFYEDLTIDKLALIGDNYGLSGNVTGITATDMYLPMTGKVTVNTNNIVYDDDLQVRILWNYSYSAAIQRLVSFVEYAYPEVEEGMRRQYAINIIMNYASRSVEAQQELVDNAIRYYKERLMTDNDKDMTEKEIYDAACQLLMYNEKYDFTSNTIDITGGAAMKTATVLLRYGESSYVRIVEMKVRLLFGDYTPVKYYVATGEGESFAYDEIAAVNTVNDLPKELYIGVRTKYWNDTENKSQYITDGVRAPYDQISDDAYKLLHDAFFVGNDDPSVDHINALRRIKISEIVYGDVVDGYAVSESFVMDGVRYESNLIKIRVMA